jgi:hypothetical protein
MRFSVPSGGPALPRRRRTRLLALLAARNEMRYLPGFVANVGPQVDGIVALDGSAAFLESRDEVVELLRVPSERPAWDEIGNHRTLIEAALRHEAEWVVCVDADERLERDFRGRAEKVIRRGRPFGFEAYAVHLRELWDAPDQFRVDGLWGLKAMARLFRVRADHEFDLRPLHGGKAPLQAKVRGRYPLAELEIYHLRMVRAGDRLARRRKYEQLDPESRWQPGIGYAYLTDEAGLRRRPMRRGREYREDPRR